MSVLDTIIDFFPSLHSILNEWRVTGFVFPPHYRAACRDPGLQWPAAALPAGGLHFPLLLLCCLAGIAVAISGIMTSLSCGERRSRMFPWALGFFGAMNADAVLVHCLTPVHSDAPARVMAIEMDVVFTCAASVCLALAVAEEEGFWLSALRDKSPAVAGTVLLIAAALAPLGLPWVNEAEYIGCMLVAAGALAAHCALRWHRLAWESRAGAVLVGASLLTVVLALLFEAQLCALTRSWWTSLHVLFAGCDAAFLGLVPLFCHRLSARADRDAAEVERAEASVITRRRTRVAVQRRGAPIRALRETAVGEKIVRATPRRRQLQ
jgi:hypothetical protein